MKKKFEFVIATNKISSEHKVLKEFEFEDDTTDEEINEEVQELYDEWVNEVNNGWFKEVK